MKKITREEVSAGGVVYRVAREIPNHKFPARNASHSDVGGSNSQIKYEFLLGKHSGYHKWVLPKGLVEEGETPEIAAVREVEEEVGVRARIVGEVIKKIEYWYSANLDLSGKTTRRVASYQESGGGETKIHKQVVFYLMEIVEDLGNLGWEMEERRWVDFEEGMKLLAFETEREVFSEAGRVLDFGAPAEI